MPDIAKNSPAQLASPTGFPSTQQNLVWPGGTSSTRPIRWSGTRRLTEVRCHEAPDIRRGTRLPAAEVAGRAFAEVFGKPGFVLHLLMQDGQRHIVGAMVLTESEITDLGVGADSATLGFHQHGQQRLHVA